MAYKAPSMRILDVKLRRSLLADSWNDGDLFYDDKKELGNWDDDED